MKKVLVVVLSIVGVLALAIVGLAVFMTLGMDATKNLEIGPFDLAVLEDGDYHGSYAAGRWANEVTVEVKNHAITAVTVDKDVMFPDPKVTEDIIKKVVDKQSTDVDIVTGATVTSKAYLAAIGDALTGKK